MPAQTISRQTRPSKTMQAETTPHKPTPHVPGLPGMPPWALAGALGIFLGFPNDFFSLPPLVLLWPLALAMLGRNADSARHAFCLGWLTSLAGMVPTLYWLAMPVHDVGGLPWVPAFVCALFIAACLALPSGLFCILSWLGGKRMKRACLAIQLGLAWYLGEQFFAWLFGFPWLAIGGALAAWPVLVQASDTFGSYALGGIWVTACLFVALAWPPRRSRCSWPDLACILAGLLLAGGLVWHGLAMLGWPGTSASHCAADAGETADAGDEAYLADVEPERRTSVLMVEGNVDQNQKWLPAFQQYNVDLYTGLSRAGLGLLGKKPDLVIWPETALPFFYETRADLAAQVRAHVRNTGVPLLFGAPGTGPLASPAAAGAMQAGGAGGQAKRMGIYNRAFLLDAAGQGLGHYDKEHLVPFGEYLPSWLDWKFLEALLQGVGVYDHGTAIAPLRLGRLGLGMLICYEGIFPWLAQARVADGANILVDISNDGWFRDTPAARQHLAQTLLRALEQNRWLLRATNTGISCVVDPRGRIARQGGQFKAGWLLVQAGLEEKTSRFHRISAWILPFASILWLVIWFFSLYAGFTTSNNRLENASSE